ncbi:aromatic acid exporter family protein [Mycobacterium tuberculosis]|uniref:FUSC family protein n=1 Tax=Mycobacterium tuberculosis TaxID=1773 RepID=UPI00186664B3|nr:aromatic acid exporter family protein [Mycobacterium tuberculosis]QON47549.1 aromatic acid exporter family protein [Mycobacterium tuberculosis]
MSASLLVRTACGGRAVAQRLRTVLWPITQTSVVAGLAWYLTHDVFNHPQAFFAPISAVVCMSATNVLRARRAQQMIVGVALGIVLGAGVHALLGSGPIAMGVVVFIALSVAVLCARGLVAQGLMFINQAAISAVLVLVFASNGSVVFERLFDALVGGGLAIVFSILLFPPDPVVMLCSARADVLAAVRDILAELVNTVSDPTSAPPDWPMAAADRLHQQLNGLIEVRANAAMVARRAPRRWGVRSTVRDLDQQAVYLALLVSSVLHLARTIAGPGGDKLPTPVHAVLTDLAAGTGLADADPTAANEHAAAARATASTLQSAACGSNEVVRADIVQACVTDLQRVIERPGPSGMSA